MVKLFVFPGHRLSFLWEHLGFIKECLKFIKKHIFTKEAEIYEGSHKCNFVLLKGTFVFYRGKPIS